MDNATQLLDDDLQEINIPQVEELEATYSSVPNIITSDVENSGIFNGCDLYSSFLIDTLGIPNINYPELDKSTLNVMKDIAKDIDRTGKIHNTTITFSANASKEMIEAYIKERIDLYSAKDVKAFYFITEEEGKTTYTFSYKNADAEKVREINRAYAKEHNEPYNEVKKTIEKVPSLKQFKNKYEEQKHEKTQYQKKSLDKCKNDLEQDNKTKSKDMDL